MKKAFSIIEVLFAVSFLIMIGLAMISLNAAALRLINNAELQTVANSLNEESIAVVALAKKSSPGNFHTNVTNLGCTAGEGCFVNCPTDNLSALCNLTDVSSSVQLGRNRLQFKRSVLLSRIGTTSGYNVLAKVSWGSGISRESIVNAVIE